MITLCASLITADLITRYMGVGIAVLEFLLVLFRFWSLWKNSNKSPDEKINETIDLIKKAEKKLSKIQNQMTATKQEKIDAVEGDKKDE